MDDEMVVVGKPLPRIASVVPLDGFRVRIEWSGGGTEEIDLAPALFNHRHFVPLRSDPDLFRQVQVEDWGSALGWPGDIALSAEWIERLPRDMTNADFRQTMDDLAMTLDGMAATLGVARRQIASYRKDKPVPKHIALAMEALRERRPSAIV
ncbi:DUF2442 domain-containing protein [Consotaella aegiceratis]|uniref:DUF2442 domain-containing protein n=1 Tax=Consotaella aegiceratis TaxID=3097961 RepID=UPI002F40CD72